MLNNSIEYFYSITRAAWKSVQKDVLHNFQKMRCTVHNFQKMRCTVHNFQTIVYKSQQCKIVNISRPQKRYFLQ